MHFLHSKVLPVQWGKKLKFVQMFVFSSNFIKSKGFSKRKKEKKRKKPKPKQNKHLANLFLSCSTYWERKPFPLGNYLFDK